MNYESWACFAGIEIANQARAAAYVNEVGLGSGASVTMSRDCACGLLDEGFAHPADDPAPWYETTRLESAEYLGLYLTEVAPQSTASRSVADRARRGSLLGPLHNKGRIVQMSGLMLAHSAAGMDYGERWLETVLRGSPCGEGGCPTDDLILMPACPEDADYDFDQYFRTLVNSGLVDGPVFGPVGNLPQNFVQRASFIIMSEQPWLYHAPELLIDEAPLGTTVSESFATPTWMGEGTFKIEISNTGTTEATNILIKGQISLDGTCPVTGDGASVPLSWSYSIPSLLAEDKITIDGMRRSVDYIDASEKYVKDGLRYIDRAGPFRFPDVGSCTTMCVSISGGTSDTVVTVNGYLRE